MPFRSLLEARRALGAVATASLALAGCSGSEEGGPAAAIALQPSDVRLIGTSSSIATVEDLTVLPDGSVWVLNSVEPFPSASGPTVIGLPPAPQGRRGSAFGS